MNKLITSAAALCLVLAAPQAMAQHHDHGGDHHDGGHHGHDSHHDQHGGPGGHHNGGWHNGPGRGHDHHDWSRYRHSGSAGHRFHRGAFRWPHGYHYRRWTFGDFLPSLFFASNYWLNDWRTYGLYPPPAGLVWVRHGPDALLVDRYSGEVVRVQYNIFY